jgi:NTP pyrophosphatase (non-canonical NTP hydrolase)
MSENKILSLTEYQKWTDETAIYPSAGKKNVEELMYCGLGISSEAGEMANYIKKLYRDGDTPELRQLIRDELGDILWYAARTAEALDVSLEDVMIKNHEKLNSRKQRGVLTGSGDNR